MPPDASAHYHRIQLLSPFPDERRMKLISQRLRLSASYKANALAARAAADHQKLPREISSMLKIFHIRHMHAMPD